VEKESQIGTETSSRNSQVIHAGLYYPPGSLKAQLCVRGKELLYEYCRSRRVGYRQCGKLIVAKTERQLADVLHHLHSNARTLGVPTTIFRNVDEIVAREPGLARSEIRAALWSPTTGILDTHEFIYSLLADIQELSADGRFGNATLALDAAVDDGRLSTDGSNDWSINICIQGTWLQTSTLINCTGLWANEVASLFHDNDRTYRWVPPRQYFAKVRCLLRLSRMGTAV
jgi:L-2-hydroxyglutarate oxidase LhgO